MSSGAAPMPTEELTAATGQDAVAEARRLIADVGEAEGDRRPLHDLLDRWRKPQTK